MRMRIEDEDEDEDGDEALVPSHPRQDPASEPATPVGIFLPELTRFSFDYLLRMNESCRGD